MTDTETAGRFLTFVIAGDVFALNISDVTEILAYRSVTQVPMMPSFVHGVLNLRGRVVPVVDLAARFGRGTTALARRTSIVIVDVSAHPGEQEETAAHREIGILVDTVNEVVHLEAGDIEPAPQFGGGIRTDFIAGMAKRNGTFTVVLEVGRVLSVDEMVALARPERQAA